MLFDSKLTILSNLRYRVLAVLGESKIKCLLKTFLLSILSQCLSSGMMHLVILCCWEVRMELCICFMNCAGEGIRYNCV